MGHREIEPLKGVVRKKDLFWTPRCLHTYGAIVQAGVAIFVPWDWLVETKQVTTILTGFNPSFGGGVKSAGVLWSACVLNKDAGDLWKAASGVRREFHVSHCEHHLELLRKRQNHVLEICWGIWRKRMNLTTKKLNKQAAIFLFSVIILPLFFVITSSRFGLQQFKANNNPLEISSSKSLDNDQVVWIEVRRGIYGHEPEFRFRGPIVLRRKGKNPTFLFQTSTFADGKVMNHVPFVFVIHDSESFRVLTDVDI
jgi:hypothetical protein